MKLKWIQNLKLLLLAVFVTSCGKEVFVARTQNETSSIAGAAVSSSQGCANFTKIKPPVDILFVVDNSGSAGLMSASLKSAIQSTILTVSQEFDYHILVAPLIDIGTDHSLPVVASSPTGLSANVISRLVAPENITFFSAATSGGSDEKGFQRVVNIVNNNKSNGIFRTGAYTITVLISNGNDTDYVLNPNCPQCPPATDYYSNRLTDFRKFTKQYKEAVEPWNSSLLNSPNFYFMTLICHQTGANCPGVGSRYKTMSKDMHNYVNGSGLTDTSGINTFDISNNVNFISLFAGVNASIQSIILEHKYDYWPVSTVNNFDRNSVTVKKNGVPLTKGDTVDGFTLYPDLMANPGASAETQNTRYEPTPGEPFTGYLVKLYGNGRIKFNANQLKPDCLEIVTSAPKQWFGYFSISRNPDMSTMVVKKNGVSIPISDMQLLGYNSNYNIQIACTESYNGTSCAPANVNSYSAGSPGVSRSGYIIRVKSPWIFSSGDRIDIDYKPATN
ncbi:MAG: hypothetical protein ACOYL6_01305 [Bacteriovoracaceae bacterium]